MSEIEDIGKRISNALDSIQKGMEALADQAEQAAKASDQSGEVDQLRRKVEGLRAELAARDAEIARNKKIITQLRGLTHTLREAGKKGLDDPSLINSSLEAELEALRQMRDADRKELDDVLASLEPIMSEVKNA